MSPTVKRTSQAYCLSFLVNRKHGAEGNMVDKDRGVLIQTGLQKLSVLTPVSPCPCSSEQPACLWNVGTASLVKLPGAGSVACSRMLRAACSFDMLALRDG